MAFAARSAARRRLRARMLCAQARTHTHTRDAIARGRAAQALWSSTFAFSCNLLLLVVFEVVGVIDPGCGRAAYG
jgi:hypothetical protein